MKLSTAIANAQKNNPDLAASIELPEIQIYLFWEGGPICSYKAIKDSKVLFEGNDYRPSPMNHLNSLKSIVELLSFLTLQIGDTDNEYFAKYTPAQLDWCNSFECEQLKGRVSDFDNASEPEYQKEAIEYFTAAFNLPIYKDKVIFLVNETNGENDLFAFFPELEFSSGAKTSYSHIGQHSACSIEYAKESRLATKKEYKPLLKELEGLGYTLEILTEAWLS